MNRMNSEKANNAKANQVVLIGLLVWGVIFAWILAFSESIPFLECDQHVINHRDKLMVLTIASMTAAATLLTTTPQDNAVKQLAFLLIAVTGVVAAIVAIPARSWFLLGFLSAGMLPVASAFFYVFWCLFKRSRWAYFLLVLGAAMVWAAAFLLHADLGMSLQEKMGDSAFDALVMGLAFKGFASAAVGWSWYHLNERRRSRQTSGSDG